MTMTRWDLTKAEEKVKELASVMERVKGDQILILCHNNPDPDSIASAFGLHFLLARRFGIRSLIAYGGVVTRAENKTMIQRLRIKMARLSEIDHARFHHIALVDAQPGTGNNLLESREYVPLIVIDHHPVRKASYKSAFHDLRPRYGATSTMITEYLAVSELTPSRTLANALLYGIKSDTNTLARGALPADFQAFKYLFPLTNPRVIGWIEKPALSLSYFEDYQRGLSQTVLYRDVAISKLGRVNSESIVPELADLLLRLDHVSWALCMGEVHDLLILSLRSTSRRRKAGIVIRRLVGKTGFGGGHREMAGGQILLKGMDCEARAELPAKIVSRFLELLGRDSCHPRRMVTRPGDDLADCLEEMEA
jgi:nanoRNase/pAp phosphatase (c-di-AMP/oligoRNAs hydrolase)